MSVIKAKRKESQFEVFHHLYDLRKGITDLLLRDFGYSESKSKRYIEKSFSGKNFEELTETEKEHYNKRKIRDDAFHLWFIVNQRNTIIDCLRNITKEVFSANSIYPTCREELIRRRIHQDEALGQCYWLLQELQYSIEMLPVDVNVYLRFADEIQTEINLIKGWRKSDNKFKRVISDSAANFANVNNNGNANNNNASNSNGVRPDFNPAIKKVDSVLHERKEK